MTASPGVRTLATVALYIHNPYTYLGGWWVVSQLFSDDLPLVNFPGMLLLLHECHEYGILMPGSLCECINLPILTASWLLDSYE